MKKLNEIIEKEWGVHIKVIDKDAPLIILAEDIAMAEMNCSRKEAYGMYIEKPDLHLPGLISFYIIDEMGLDPEKVNAGMTLSQIFALQEL
jgi:hypothetical protein